MLPGWYKAFEQQPESISRLILQLFPPSSVIHSLASAVLVYIYSAEWLNILILKEISTFSTKLFAREVSHEIIYLCTEAKHVATT